LYTKTNKKTNTKIILTLIKIIFKAFDFSVNIFGFCVLSFKSAKRILFVKGLFPETFSIGIQEQLHDLSVKPPGHFLLLQEGIFLQNSITRISWRTKSNRRFITHFII
jgi:hypothetical protein